jgi:hypothetical protein
MNTRELRAVLLMTLPIGLLAVSARWVQQRQQLASWNQMPLRAKVQSVRPVALTPHHIAAGYDTRFEVLLTGQNRPVLPRDAERIWRAQNFGLLHAKTGHAIEAGNNIGWDKFTFDEARNVLKTHFYFKLRQLPVSRTPLQFTGDFEAHQYNTLHQPPTQVLRVQPFRVRFLVSKPGQQVAVPQVSRYTPLHSPQVTIEKHSAPTGPPKFFYEIKVKFKSSEPLGPDDLPRVVENSTYVIDEKGKRHHKNPWGESTGIHPGDNKCSVTWLYTPTGQQLKAKRLELHSRLSLNDTWPHDVKAVIWDKTNTGKSQPPNRSRPTRSTSRAVHSKR